MLAIHRYKPLAIQVTLIYMTQDEVISAAIILFSSVYSTEEQKPITLNCHLFSPDICLGNQHCFQQPVTAIKMSHGPKLTINSHFQIIYTPWYAPKCLIAGSIIPRRKTFICSICSFSQGKQCYFDSRQIPDLNFSKWFTC